jgi:hypothetical protein
MNAKARPYIAIVFYLSAFLALIFAFIYFMRMQEEAGDIHRLKVQGHVSRAIVTGKKEDSITRTEQSGTRRSSSATRTTSSPINVLNIRFEPRSTVPFADYGTKVQDAGLPGAPPLTGNVMADGQYVGVMWVSDEVFAATKVGDTLIVVNTPFNRSAPKLVSEVRAYDGSSAYPWIGGSLLLAAAFGLIGLFISRGGRRATGA